MSECNHFRRTRTSLAILLALSPTAFQVAHAGAGFGDNLNGLGAPIKVQTYYANSPSGLRPDADCFDATGVTNPAVSGGLCDTGKPLRKFVDSLPGLGSGSQNNLGQYIPVAIPDTTTYPGSDYYEIAVVDYAEKLHSDLAKATHLRGYVQLSTAIIKGNTPLSNADNTPVIMPDGTPAIGVDKAHYLGPLIQATKGRAVRIKYYNLLPTGKAGKMFIPVDATLTDAGIAPNGLSIYSENRAAIHWHGGDTPWISDGTPHQWIAPMGETSPKTGLPMGKGVSTVSVPDMPNPGEGAQTLYFPNNMSGRFMFYHDHTAGLTRLNVYAGIAAGYMLNDPTEAAMVAGGQPLDANGAAIPNTPSFAAGTLPADQIPLIIQDKTFVPKDIAQQDAKWNQDINGTPVNVWGQEGDLWFPHVYETNQDPASLDATNPVGRWDWGPWFWPVFPSAYSLPSGYVGDATTVPESFMDTPVVNGTAYPTTTVEPKAYRFRILNAANDRFLNLGLYIADSAVSIITVNTGGTGYTGTPTVTITDATGTGATATASVLNGVITALTVTSAGTGYSATPTVTITDATGTGATATATVAVNTEVQMVPFDTTQAAITPFPDANSVNPGLQGTGWGTPDSTLHQSGVPNPTKLGPDIIQIGSEGGFLPHAVPIPSTPINYEYNKRSVTVLNVLEHGVWMGPAERVDTVIDFSQYAGKTLILYNDAPAPLPAGDPRIDYFTGSPDQSGAGGAAPTLAGFGPNTRTIMQIKVSGSGAGTPFDVAKLEAAIPKAYAVEQAPPVIPEAAYNDAFGTHDADNLFKISTGSLAQPTMDFTPTGTSPMTLKSIKLVGGGTGYIKAPSVTISGGGGIGATAIATINAVTRMVTSIQLTNVGAGYTSLPTILFTPVQGGVGATASVVSNTTKTLPVQNKGIQELFDPVYGRMNATFSVELPYTTALTQTTIPLAYIDPATEVIADGETQIWKITHNGVDSHPVHFHLVNVQVINRVGWDGTIKPPYENEFGWKETLRMNPLEDVYVAATAKKPITNGFGLPQSVRLRDPSQPLGSPLGFTQIDPVTGVPASISNAVDNYNNEYVWHCHILGHEENDFMRPVVFQPGGASQVGAVRTELPLPAPVAPTLTSVSTTGVVNWVDNSDKEFRFDIARAPVTTTVRRGVTTTTVGAFATIGTALANAGMANWSTPGSFTDKSAISGATYEYKVAAVGAAATGSSIINTTASSYSSTIRTTVTALPIAPTGLTAVPSTTAKAMVLTWIDSPNETSYQVLRNGVVIAASLPANTTSYTDTATTSNVLVANTTYSYTVTAVNNVGTAPTNITVTTPSVPAAPAVTLGAMTATTVSFTTPASTGVTYAVTGGRAPTVAISAGIARVTDSGLTGGTTYNYSVTATNVWGPSIVSSVTATTQVAIPSTPAAPTVASITDTSLTLNWAVVTGATSYTVQRATNTNFTQGLVTATGVLTNSLAVTGLTGNTSYYFRVSAVNGTGASANSGSKTQLTMPTVLTVIAAATNSTAGGAITAGLTWTNPAGGAASYQVRWSNASAMTTPTTVNNATSNTQITVAGAARTVYMQVQSVNATGTSTWSPVTPVAVSAR